MPDKKKLIKEIAGDFEIYIKKQAGSMRALKRIAKGYQVQKKRKILYPAVNKRQE